MTHDGLIPIVEATIAELEPMNLAPSDRGIVLQALLRARLAGGTFAQAIPVPGGSGNPRSPIQPAAEGDVVGKLAIALQISTDKLELVYDVVDGAPALVVSAKKISTNKSTAARQLGQLIAAARQIAGIEDWTSANVIRKVVQDYGRLDGSNFAASLQQMENVAVLRGKGASREVKITKPGIESTAELIKSIAGDV